MRISDWSSDVCSSDLRPGPRLIEPPAARTEIDPWSGTILDRGERRIDDIRPHDHTGAPTERGIVDGAVLIARETADVQRFQRPYSRREIGRASCRERVCQSV